MDLESQLWLATTSLGSSIQRFLCSPNVMVVEDSVLFHHKQNESGPSPASNSNKDALNPRGFRSKDVVHGIRYQIIVFVVH